jgi:hypothetical protein
MTTYGCPCPYGCPRQAAGMDLCSNCQLGFHGRYCTKFVARPPDTDVWRSDDCAECGGWRFDHPESPYFGRTQWPGATRPARA